MKFKYAIGDIVIANSKQWKVKKVTFEIDSNGKWQNFYLLERLYDLLLCWRNEICITSVKKGEKMPRFIDKVITIKIDCIVSIPVDKLSKNLVTARLELARLFDDYSGNCGSVKKEIEERITAWLVSVYKATTHKIDARIESIEDEKER